MEMGRRKRESGVETEDPGSSQGAGSGGPGPGSWEGPVARLSGGTAGRKAEMVERGCPGQGQEGRPGRREGATGRAKKLLGPAYQDLKRPHPSAVPSVEPPTSQDLPSESLTRAPRLHIYEAQLIMQHQAGLRVPGLPAPSPLRPGEARGSCLSGAHLPPSTALPLPPSSHTPSPWPAAFTGAEAVSARQPEEGQLRQQGAVSWKRALSPRNILFGLLPALRGCQEPE